MISIYAGHCILKDNRQKIKIKVSEVIVVVAEHDRDNSGIWIQYILPHGLFLHVIWKYNKILALNATYLSTMLLILEF